MMKANVSYRSIHGTRLAYLFHTPHALLKINLVSFGLFLSAVSLIRWMESSMRILKEFPSNWDEKYLMCHN